MSIITRNKDLTLVEEMRVEADPQTHMPKESMSAYNPSDEERMARQMVIRHFTLGDIIMRRPRREFNDLSVIQRYTVDKESYNTYSPNNGEALEGDEVNAWKSRAIKPIVRNKCNSMAAHVLAQQLFPKIFAYSQTDTQEKAAQVMEDLMEWSGDKSGYRMTSLKATLTALWSPASIIYSEFRDSYRDIKVEEDGFGGWKKTTVCDEDMSGFQDEVVPTDELYIENIFENNIQKQGWLIWRKVQSYTLLKAKYEKLYPEQFKYVKPGVQIIYNDANQAFYEKYDTNMRQYQCEEIVYWNKNMDVKLILVNGVLLTSPDNPNPRQDKLYPFTKFGFELIDEGRFFYYKSLAFKLMQDANIVNSLYPMIIDGTYLSIYPPMIGTGAEQINANVIMPGVVTTFASPDADLKAINLGQNLNAGMAVLNEVESSISDSSQTLQIATGKKQTAFELNIREREAQIMLGLFTEMIGAFVRDFGRLRLGDILQYMTVAEVSELEDNAELVYKTFFLPNKESSGKIKTRKLKFDLSIPDKPISAQEALALSYKTLEEQGGQDSDTELYRINPNLFRQLKYMIVATPDTMKAHSEDVEKAWMLEEYDRAINNPILDQERVTKDFLLGAYKVSKKDPDKYIKKQEPMTQNPMDLINQQGQQGQQGQGQGQPQQKTPQPGGQNSPLATVARTQAQAGVAL